MAGAAVVVAAAIVAGAYFFTHRARKLTSKDSIVLADFTNTTGDSVFDGTLRQGLAAQLGQSPFLNIVSDQQIAGTLRLMGQPTDARLTNELARQVCQRDSSAAVLEGSIAQIGSQYNLILSAVNCSTGAMLTSAQAVASDKNHVLDALGKLASDIRSKLGESLGSVEKFDTPLEQATTPSLEALQAYSMGWKTHIRGDDAAAIPLLERAISLDPNFAMAYSVLGQGYADLGESSLAAENVTKAYELRDRASEPEKLYISAHYDFIVTGNLEKAIQDCQLWAQTYPRDAAPAADLSGIYGWLGQYDKALAEAHETLRISPASGLDYANLAGAYVVLDRLDEAKAVIQQAESDKINSPDFPLVLYTIAFLEHDAAGMAQQAAQAMGKPGLEDLVLDMESGTAAYSGQLAKANDLTRRAMASAQQAGKRETAANHQAEAALREALFGNTAEAKQGAEAALKLSSGRDVEAAAALALALSGDEAQAERLADDLAKRFPEDTIAQFNSLPTIRAGIALGQGNPAKAIEALQAASPYELGSTALSLYPVYVRGEAYLALDQSNAAAEFQKILGHPGIVSMEPIGALAHLGLARAEALAGNKEASRKAYQDFFALWQAADPSVPVLRQAKAEYAKPQ